MLFPDVTYSFYKVWADLFKVPFETPALKEDFTIDTKDYAKENGGVIFPNQTHLPACICLLDQIEEILIANQDVVVIVDEAYGFCRTFCPGAVRKVRKSPGSPDFQQVSLHGRYAYWFCNGASGSIRALNNVKYSYNSYTMNLPSLLAGVEAVKDKAYFESIPWQRWWLLEERSKKRLAELGFTFPDSRSNFIFCFS